MTGAAKQPWVGLIGLKPRPGNEILGSAQGAYVYMLALATDERDFRKAVLVSLEEFGFGLEEMDEVEPFSAKLLRGNVDDYLVERASKVAQDGKTRYGEFFLHEEE
jgi:hypothetical protein